MNVDLIVVYLLLSIIAFLALALTIMVASYLQAVKKLNKLSNQIGEEQENWESLHQSSSKSPSTSAIEASFKALSSQLMPEFKDMLEKLKKQQIDIFQNVSKDIEKATLMEVDEFKKVLEKETVWSQQIVAGKLEKAYQDVQKELDEYRNTQMKKIDDGIYNVLMAVSQAVLKRSIPLEEQENLIKEALNLAKDELQAINHPVVSKVRGTTDK